MLNIAVQASSSLSKEFTFTLDVENMSKQVTFAPNIDNNGHNFLQLSRYVGLQTDLIIFLHSQVSKEPGNNRTNPNFRLDIVSQIQDLGAGLALRCTSQLAPEELQHAIVEDVINAQMRQGDLREAGVSSNQAEAISWVLSLCFAVGEHSTSCYCHFFTSFASIRSH